MRELECLGRKVVGEGGSEIILAGLRREFPQGGTSLAGLHDGRSISISMVDELQPPEGSEIYFVDDETCFIRTPDLVMWSCPEEDAACLVDFTSCRIVAKGTCARTIDLVRSGVLLLAASKLEEQDIVGLRASSIEHDGQCVLIIGEPGSGKSTLAFAIATETEFSMVADDVSLIDISGSPATLLPFPCMARVDKKETIRLLGQEPDKAQVICKGRRKRLLVPICVGDHIHSHPITDIFYLTRRVVACGSLAHSSLGDAEIERLVAAHLAPIGSRYNFAPERRHLLSECLRLALTDVRVYTVNVGHDFRALAHHVAEVLDRNQRCG